MYTIYISKNIIACCLKIIFSKFVALPFFNGFVGSDVES